jgi:peptidoglycan/xylan/chitin deacetylase (PgdA/CDA1 family)
MKNIARRLIKLPALVPGIFTASGTGYSYLIYHSVSGQLACELDLDFPIFRRQLTFLAQTCRVVSYGQALCELQTNRQSPEPTFVLTFDDGYEDFYTHVFPLLRELNLPATLYVTTGFVEEKVPYPMLRHRACGIRPVTWEMLGEMMESELVTVAAHTHTHPDLSQAPDERVIEELAKPIELFRRRLGVDVPHFAYPKALWTPHVERFVQHHYRSAVIGVGRRATSATFDPYRIPRLPIRRSDGWAFFRAKVQGWLAGEEAIYERLRRLARASAYPSYRLGKKVAQKPEHEKRCS